MNGFTYENTDRKEQYETYEWDNLWIEHADKPELKRVLYIGDSISCGTRGYATSQAEGTMYFDNFSTSKAVDNAYFKDALKAFTRQLPRRDAVIFNNGLHGWHLDDDTEYRKYYEEMIKFLLEEFSGTPVAIVLTTFITDECRINRVKARNKVATDIAAKYNLPVIDLYSLTEASPELLMEDRVHFSPDGYKMIANEIIKSVNEILKTEMNIGIKLPFDIFCDTKSEASHIFCEAFGGCDGLLDYLSNAVSAVELGVIEHTLNPSVLKEAAFICNGYGLSVTLHGSANGVSDAEEFFAPYTLLFGSGLQPLYNITVHPLTNPQKTEALLKSICEHADAMNYPVRITLENQRFAGEKFRNTLCRDVADIVHKINHPKLYICFDFGHQLSNIRQNGDNFDVTEDKFLSQVRHTHIHSLFEGVTHFPLNCGETALEHNLTKLTCQSYDGVFLLELAPARYCGKFDVKASIEASVSALKTAIYQVLRKSDVISEYKNNFCRYVNDINVGLSEINCGLGVLAPAMYILKFGNTKIAVDPSLWDLPVDICAKDTLTGILNSCDAAIVTHTHGDHFDPDILSSLNIPCFIPDFIPYRRNNVILTNDGYETAVGDVKLTFFESAHSLNESIVPEYGFCINFNGKNYVFPSDVRDYNKSHRTFTDTDAVILHLWLGKGNALNLYSNGCIDDFCSFANSFGAKKVYLSHMLDIRREIEDMWSEIHFESVKNRIDNCSILKSGSLAEF